MFGTELIVMEKEMQAIVVESFGGAEHAQRKEVDKPSALEGEVLIKMAYSSVNPVDWKIREGMIQNMLPHDLPLILGWDAAGVIEDIGPGVEGFEIGDEVFAYCRKDKVKWGTYAEYVSFDADKVVLKPKSLSLAESASVPLASLTAWQTLFDFAQVKEGQTVLIHAGAGGVGSFAIQLARWKGCQVLTTASAKNRDYVLGLGADVVIDYQNEQVSSVLEKYAPDGVDFILDGVGGKVLEDSYFQVRNGGVLVTMVEAVDKERAKSLNIKACSFFVRPDGEQLTEIRNLIDQGILQVPHIKQMSWDEAVEALEENKAGHTKGKIVLKIG